jgi:hypothetical protein
MRMSLLRWPLLALAGLLVAAAVAILAVQAVSGKIGISSEPLSSGRALAPKETRADRGNGGSATTTTTTGSSGTTPAPTPSPNPATSPSGGDEHGGETGGGGGGDD